MVNRRRARLSASPMRLPARPEASPGSEARKDLSLGIVGTGAVARAIAHATAATRSDADAAELLVVSRSRSRAHALASAVGGRAATAKDVASCDLVLVAVPDRAVGEVGAALAGAGVACPVLHTSGALEGSALGGGLSFGSLHPLQSFPRNAAGAVLAARLAGAHVFHEGAGRSVARRLAAAWGSPFHTIRPGRKALYHAGAAVASNHAVALFADAVALFGRAGIDAGAAAAALAPLLRGTAENVAALGPVRALTGPVVRGDAATVALHVRRIAEEAPELSESYAAMARRALALALRRGALDAEAAAAVEAALVTPSRRRRRRS